MADLIGLYLGGASTYAIAEQFSIRRDQVALVLKRAGVAVDSGPRVALDAARKREIAKLYPQGWSLRRLAQRYGASDNTILKALREQGVPTRRRPGA